MQLKKLSIDGFFFRFDLNLPQKDCVISRHVSRCEWPDIIGIYQNVLLS